MSAFLLIEIEIRDPGTYAEYMQLVPAVVERHGGRYLARGGTTLPLTGDWRPERLIIMEFESLEAIGRFVLSTEYQEISPLRERAAATRAIAVEGC